MSLLRIKNISKSYWLASNDIIDVVKDVSFEINEGEFFGVVGESGCGKSTIAKIAMGIIENDSGSIYLDNKEIQVPYNKHVYRKIQMIFQMPKESFDPRRTVGSCLSLVIKTNTDNVMSKDEIFDRVIELLSEVGLDEEIYYKYPHQLSGGQCQRVAIARAIAVNPKLIICDEITSALDVTVQAQIVELLLFLKAKYDISIIFISHDLALVENLCDRVIVVKDGSIVEEGIARDVLTNPQNEYTKELVSSILQI